MINVLFCGNDKVFDGILSSMISILKRTKTENTFHFYIYTMDASFVNDKYLPINDQMLNFLEKLAKSYNENNIVSLIDVGELYNKEFRNCPNEQCYCSPYTLLRLLLDEVENMPNDKLLYLDVDLLFNKDITLLYNIDVTGYEYAAGRDQYGKFLIQPNYINGGVLLFNMEIIRKTKLLTKARELIRQKHLPFADQSAILRSTTKRKMLPQCFNDQRRVNDKTVIRHFAQKLYWLPYPHVENIKQWNLNRYFKVFNYKELNDIIYDYIYMKECFIRNKEI